MQVQRVHVTIMKQKQYNKVNVLINLNILRLYGPLNDLLLYSKTFHLIQNH